MAQALSFCKGCMTDAAWAPGGLCPTCMLRKQIEKSQQPQTAGYTYNPDVEPPMNLLGQFLGMIAGWGLTVGLFIWVFKDDTYWNCVLDALMLPFWALFYLASFILHIFT
jgi:hypothetical protein